MWLERPVANVKVALVLGSNPTSVDTVESKRQQMKQCGILCKKYMKRKKLLLPRFLWCDFSSVFGDDMNKKGLLTQQSVEWFFLLDKLSSVSLTLRADGRTF